ncbi:MAG: peptidylprolyl isomerase [Thioalkalispiraceae bacterium]
MAEPVQVNMETSQGDIVLELYPDKAPKTVANFLQYVEDGFYSNTIFHRVIDNFMIQGGGFDNNYMRKQTRAPILNEADNGLKNELGTIAMARTMDPHSATAQFFINVKDNDFLNHSNKTPRGWGYAVFGKVIKGMQTVDKIRQIPTGKGGPFPSDVPQIMVTIKSMSVVSTAKPQDKK